MAITKFTTSGINNIVKYDDFLAGNTAYDPAGYWSIASATGTGSSGAVTFSSIPTGYTHLQIRFIAKDTYTTAADADAIYLRFNSDSATNYTRHLLAGDGSSATASGVINMQGAWVPRAIPTSGTGLSNMMGVGIIDILDYNSTSKFKTVRSLSGTNTNGLASPNDGICVSSALWRSTSAVTSISIYSNYSNVFTTSSQFELYGIKESA